MKLFDEHVQDLADAILTAREFCGDEQEAIREYLAEHGFPKLSIVAPERDRVMYHASQRAAEEWMRRKMEARR